jgi:hypothetical protein
VEVRLLDASANDASTLGSMLLKHAGVIGDLPADASEQLDHYLYGVPKRC